MSNSDSHDFIRQMLAEADRLQAVASKKSGSLSIQTEQTEEIIPDLGNSYDFDGFQVVRREFFAHTREPAIVFNNCKFSVNQACLQKFPETDTIQVLVNKETKILAVKPCPETIRDSFAWCSERKGKRVPKQITCKLFFAKIFSMMNWNPIHRYKLLGKLIRANDETLLVFDLTATEIYQRSADEGKTTSSRVPVFPVEWQNQFGLPYNEHKQSLQIDILKGYAVYSIKDNSPQESDIVNERAVIVSNG